MAHAAHDDHEGAHDAHDDHHEEPALPEPETPLWLTLLGIGIFVLGGLFLLVRQGNQQTDAAAASASASAPAPPTTAVAVPQQPMLPSRAKP